MLALLSCSALLIQPAKTLSVGPDSYVAGPAIRLGRFISSSVFSRDGSFVTFVDERVEGSYAAQRERLARQTESTGRALVRVDLKTGVRQTLYTPQPGETLMWVEPVGRGGDVLCSIAMENLPKDQISWKAIYCPAEGGVQVVADRVAARSFQFAASFTERKAFLLITNEDQRTRYLFLTPSRTVEKTLNVNSYQGGFTIRTKDGSPVLFLQGRPPGFSVVGLYLLSFIDGSSEKLQGLPQEGDISVPEPLIRFETIERSKPKDGTDQLPLNDLTAVAGKQELQRSRLTIAQGIIAITEEAPEGNGIVYLRDDGFYARAMIKVRR